MNIIESKALRNPAAKKPILLFFFFLLNTLSHLLDHQIPPQNTAWETPE